MEDVRTLEDGRTFSNLELCCFSKGCLIPPDLQPPLATTFIPQLEAAGMTAANWIRGSQLFEEPHFSKVKDIVCSRCNIRKCSINPRFMGFDDLRDLMDGRYADRIDKGDKLLEQLLSREKKAELEQRGIKVIALQMLSRKNPQLVFSFTCDGKTRRVSCEVGTRRLRTDEREEALLSTEQLSQKIEDAMHAFS